jgi:hypothetical protein
MRRALVLTVASLFVAVAAGCGAGASAGGGTGAYVSYGGAGGASLGNGGGGGFASDTCDAATEQLAATPATPLGFTSTEMWDSPSSAVIADVTPTKMELVVGPNSVPVTFNFAGADLTQAFAKGATVVVHQDRGYDTQKLYGWSYVEGARSAAVHNDDELTMYGTALAAPPSPVGGPAIAFIPQCDFFSPMADCQTSIDITVLSVAATLGGQSITIPVGQTADLGGFQIYAGFSTEDSVTGATSCTIETGWTHALTVLTPPAP